jgi:hypothetical protein
LVTDLDNDFKFSWSEDSISSTVLSFSVFVLVPPPYCMLGFLFSFENKVVSLSKLILFSNANRSFKGCKSSIATLSLVNFILINPINNHFT